jgi:hypothetical protein
MSEPILRDGIRRPRPDSHLQSATALLRRRKAAVKIHTLLDIHGPIPVFVWISEGNVHDVNVLDALLPEPGAIYLMDRAYIDFKRLHALTDGNAFFVTRAKSNMRFRRPGGHQHQLLPGLERQGSRDGN